MTRVVVGAPPSLLRAHRRSCALNALAGALATCPSRCLICHPALDAGSSRVGRGSPGLMALDARSLSGMTSVGDGRRIRVHRGTAPGRQAGACLPIQLYWSQFTLRDRFTCPICAYFQSQRALPILLDPLQTSGPSLFIRFAHSASPPLVASFVIPRLTRDPVGWGYVLRAGWLWMSGMTQVVVVVGAYSFTEGTAPGRQAGTCLPIQLYWSHLHC